MQVDWVRLVQAQIPMWMRRPRMISWVLVLIDPVRKLCAQFFIYRRRSLYDLSITGQTNQLERLLNDEFDTTLRRIWIETLDDLSQFYLYNKIELRPPFYLYNKWQAATPYALGSYLAHGTGVWRALVNNPSEAPSEDSAEWAYVRKRLYLRNKAEGLTSIDFIIHIPEEILVNEPQLRALIALYKLAGKRYTIETF